MSSSMRSSSAAPLVPSMSFVPTERPYNYAVVLLGPEGVGKTAILNKYLHPDLNNLVTVPTILAHTQTLQMPATIDLPACNLIFNDTAGSEAYAWARSSFIRDEVSALLFVFSGCESSSQLDEFISSIAFAENSNCRPKIYAVIHRKQAETVTQQADFKKQLSAAFLNGLALTPTGIYECSACSGEGIQPMFKEIYAQITANQIEQQKMKKLSAFKRIYRDLHKAQVGVYKTDFLPSLQAFEQNSQELGADQKLNFIQAHIVAHREGRTAKAWELAGLHANFCAVENQVLVAEIKQWAESKTGLVNGALCQIFGMFRRSGSELLSGQVPTLGTPLTSMTPKNSFCTNLGSIYKR